MPRSPITLNADSITLGGTTSVRSTGSLTIQPRTAGTTIGLGGGTGALADLSDAELLLLTDGFSSITIGNTTAGAVDINSATFTDPLNILGATIDVADNLDAGANAVSLTATTIFTQGGAAVGTDVTASTVTFNGNVSPGAAGLSRGQVIVAGNVTFDSSDTFTVELNGATPAGTDYDQLSVTGASRTVTLGNATLAPTLDYAPGANDVLEIIDTPNDSTTPVSGTFNGLAEGAQLLLSQGGNIHPFTISYQAGDGNDVALTYNRNPVITGTTGADAFFVFINSGNIEVHTGGNAAGPLVMQTPLANLSSLTINGDAGADTLTIDYGANGHFELDMTFNGGNPTANPGDAITFAAATVTSVTHTFTNASDGSIAVVSGGNTSTITYTGLEPITDNLSATDRTFTFNGGSEAISLADAAGAAMTIDSTLGESVTFVNPTTSLTINTGTGDDDLDIDSLDAAFAANITINGGDGTDQLDIDGALTYIGSFSVATVETINVNNSITANAGITFTTPTTTHLFANLQTDGGNISINGGQIVLHQATTTLDTESGNDSIAGAIDLTNTGTAGDAAGNRGLVLNTATSTTLASGNITLGALNAAGGSAVTNVTANATNAGTGTWGDVTFSGDGSIGGLFNIDARTITVNANVDLSTNSSSASAITFDAQRNIRLLDSSSLSVVDGNMTVNANASGTTTGNFVGLEANNAALRTTGTGDIALVGRGADNGQTNSDQYGVFLHSGTSVTSSQTGSNAGTITITGTGGAGTGSNYGVFLLGSTTDVTSVAGDITITGTGGDGSGSLNTGVFVSDIETVSSTGTGSDAAKITITGTGGVGTIANVGVYLLGSTTDVTSVAGDITITGTGGNGSGFNNHGVFVNLIETISSTGTGSDAAKITITGTGGAGTDSNRGVVLFGSTTDVTSVAGDITITGTGGNGSSDSHYGVFIESIEAISSTGTGSDAAKITITGTGGAGTSDNYGVILFGITTDVTSVAGDITITGTGGNGSSSGNYGVLIESIETISSTGTGGNAAKITITGTGAAGTLFNYGVIFNGSTTDVTSVAGDITIAGTGGNGSSGFNIGVYVTDIDTISSTGTGSDAAKITITGTGGAGTDSNWGVLLSDSTTDVTSVDGDITITGVGGNGSANNNFGVLFAFDATVQVTSGALMVTGTAVAGNSAGVWLSEFTGGRLVSIGSGSITITAVGNGTEPDLLAGSDSIIGDAMHVGAATAATGPITINADSIDFQGTLSVESDGALTIQPRTASTTIGLGDTSTGTLNLTAAELAFLQDGFSSITIGNAANGTGAVDIKTSTFTDPVTIVGGSIAVDGLDAGTNAVTLTARNNGLITSPSGVASLPEDVTGSPVTFNGTVAPGATPTTGVLVVDGDVTFDSSDTLTLELNGTSTGTAYDQLRVRGAARQVALGGATLNATLGYAPGSTDVLEIVRTPDDAATPVNGTFNGLPEGAQLLLPFGGNIHPFSISYVAGDGNNVALLYDQTPTITGTSGADSFFVLINGGNVEVHTGGSAGGPLVMSTPLANLTSLTIDGDDGRRYADD